MKLLDSSIKFITEIKIFEDPKAFPTRAEHNKYFPNTTENLNIFKFKKITQYFIELTFRFNQFKHGDENILTLLRHSLSWIK